MTGCEHCRDALGGHVLAALEPSESEEVEAHLAECPDCRAEHRALAVLPAMLDLADPSAVPAERPPARLEERVLDRFAHSRRERHGASGSRRRRRLRLAGAGAGGVLAGVAASAAAFVLLAPERPAPPEARATEVSLTSPGSGRGASGRVTLTARTEGTSVRLEAHSLRPTRGSEVYELWFLRRGEQVSAGTFRVPRDGRVGARMSAAAAFDRYATIAVTREPDRSDPGPSEAVVLSGKV